MTVRSLFDGQSGRPGVGSSGTQPPSSPLPYSGPYTAGLAFCVTTGGQWLSGYRWWVPPGGQVTAGQKFALWQVTAAASGVLVPGSTVTAGTLTAGQWNYVPLAVPLLLAPGDSGATGFGATYVAAAGYTSTAGFPDTQHQFGGGEPYAAGIANGPLFAYSSASGSAPAGGVGRWVPQQPFGVSTADPAAAMPVLNDADDLLWLDVQVSDVPPSGAVTYRGFPNMPAFAVATPQSVSYTLGMEFSVSSPCKLYRIWHYSPATSTVLPTRCGLWNVAAQTEVAGSDNSSPSWLVPGGGAATAGDGWIYADYSTAGVTLAPGTNYKVSTFCNAGSSVWFSALANFWSTAFAGGITQGPLAIPGNSAATAPGQDSWNTGSTWTYPATSTNPEWDGIDVEVLPVTASSSGLLMASII